MSSVAEIVESISRHVESLQNDVLRLSRKVSENPEDSYYRNMIDLVLNPVFRSWCYEAGLSIYECDVMAEGTIIGSVYREKIVVAMKEAAKKAIAELKEKSHHGAFFPDEEKSDG